MTPTVFYEYRFYYEANKWKEIEWVATEYDPDADKFLMMSIQNGRTVTCWRKAVTNKVRRVSRGKYYSVMLSYQSFETPLKKIRDYMVTRIKQTSNLFINYTEEYNTFGYVYTEEMTAINELKGVQ